jgi:uncharacterized OB-fold protein
MHVMVREGLFTDGDAPSLLGSHCRHCGATLFPRTDHCGYCATPDPDRVELSRTGTLWAWTAVTSPPPGYQGEVPFGIGVVELPEGVRVIARLTESDPAELRSGQPMSLHVVPLHTDGEGRDVVTFAFGPEQGS